MLIWQLSQPILYKVDLVSNVEPTYKYEYSYIFFYQVESQVASHASHITNSIRRRISVDRAYLLLLCARYVALYTLCILVHPIAVEL